MKKYENIDKRMDETIRKLRTDPNHIPQNVNCIDRVQREFVKWLSDQRENNTDVGTVYHALNQLILNMLLETVRLTISEDTEAYIGVPTNMMEAVLSQIPGLMEWGKDTGMVPLSMNIDWPPTDQPATPTSH